MHPTTVTQRGGTAEHPADSGKDVTIHAVNTIDDADDKPHRRDDAIPQDANAHLPSAVGPHAASTESPALLSARVSSLPHDEKLTVALLALLSASIVFNQCGLAHKDTDHRIYVPGAFSLSGVTFLTWALTIVFALLVHRFALPFSISKKGESQLKASAEFALYMIIVFVLQNSQLIRRHSKEYKRDTFCALMLLLLVASLLTMRRIPRPSAPKPKAPATSETTSTNREGAEKASLLPLASPDAHPNPPTETVVHVAPERAERGVAQSTDDIYHISPLCREQTTEWRGWMQVLFLYYHYFHATEVYNAARLCVSAYVWMTGYGNFFFYTRRKDFGLLRFCHTMWRLNFLAFCLCAALGNQFMLYYICPMHTLFTLFVYVGLYFRQDLNTTTRGVLTKLAVLTAYCVVLWDLGALSRIVFRALWWPLTWLLRYDKPVGPGGAHPLEEWQYRTGLDHLVWIAGMAFAQFQPTFDAWLRRVDALPPMRGALIKAVVGFVTVGCSVVYVKKIYMSDRDVYNKLHPYTSFIPLTLYIVLRNVFQRSRMYYSGVLYYLGNVTLESYLLQFHVWMSMVTVNGPPWNVLELIRSAPLCNFVIFSCLLVAMSERLFQLVQVIESVVFPDRAENAALLKNMSFAMMLLFTSVVLLWPAKSYVTRLPA